MNVLRYRLVLAAAPLVGLFLPASTLAGPVLTVTNGAVYTAKDTFGGSTFIVSAMQPTLVTSGGAGLAGLNQTFVTAFNNWNNSGGGQGWTLVNGGDINSSFTVSTYSAQVTFKDPNIAAKDAGGVKIQVDYNPAGGNNIGNAPNGPAPLAPPANVQLPTEAVWTQALTATVKHPASLPGNPYLDNPTDIKNADAKPPLYPFQYDGTEGNGATASMLFDFPRRTANQSWTAVAYLSTANFATDTLTVYDGVAYGFTTLIFPEPGSLTLCAVAAAGFAGVSWRKRKKKAGAE
jgi:hypothetical protein